ncbi:MAG: J domain-containing protein [Lactobacillales bacterium]|nr:J domain-containing protein [Lactobacillales bacterium]
MNQTYYEILKIKQDATKNEIKKAYYAIMKQVHPDQNTITSDEELTKIVGQAYRILMSDIERKKYDEQLEQINKNETAPQLKEQIEQLLKSESFKQLYNTKYDNDNNFKYYRALYKNITESFYLNNASSLKEKLTKLKRLDNLIKREIMLYEQQNINTEPIKNNSIVENEVGFVQEQPQEEPILIEKQEEKEEYINPIIWFDIYAKQLGEELKENKDLSIEEVEEIIAYEQGLKQEFIQLLSHFSNNPEKIEEAKRNTVKLVEQKKQELLIKNTELMIVEERTL